MASERFFLPAPPPPRTLDDARRVAEGHRRGELEPGFLHADRLHDALRIALAALDDRAAREAAHHA